MGNFSYGYGCYPKINARRQEINLLQSDADCDQVGTRLPVTCDLHPECANWTNLRPAFTVSESIVTGDLTGAICNGDRDGKAIDKRNPEVQQEFSAAEIGALAHLYRGEVYRSTIWRTRLDTTTNWAVVTLGVALSISFSSPDASPLPLILVGVLILLFLALEARRYRYFNVWRARSRWMETHFYAPILKDGDLHTEENWQTILAQDYLKPTYHIGYTTALARRVRRNYLWILLIQALAYVGKLMIHPIPAGDFATFLGRADIGPLPGEAVLAIGIIYCLVGVFLAVWVKINDARNARERGSKGEAIG